MNNFSRPKRACPGLDPGWVSLGIEAASQSPAKRVFNMGVLQT